MSKSKSVDIAPFGRMTYWTGSDPMTLEGHPADGLTPVDVPEQGGPHIGVAWDEPRRFERVAVRFEEAPSPDQVRLQYWHNTWPPAFRGGWTAVDDPFNGKWVTAHGDVEVEGDSLVFTFDPLDFTEIPQAEDFAVNYRQALKVRLLFKWISPEIKAFEIYSGSVWQEADLKIEGIKIADLEIYYGKILSTDPIKALYTDQTILSVYGEKTFSFRVTDALNGIEIPDLGVRVSSGSAEASPSHGVPIYDRIASEPEQTYERASREIPQLIKTRQGPWGRYCPIGCDANRQEYAVRYNADIFADKESMKVVGRDTARILWPGKSIFFRFPTGDPPDFREREDATKQTALNGYLPIYTSEWKDREFAYEMTSFAALLLESPWEEEKKRGDEPMVALSKVRIRNTTEEKRKARFWMVIENPEELAIDGQFIYATGRAREDNVPDAHIQKRWVVEKYPARRMRAQIRTNGKGELSVVSCTYQPFEVSTIPNAIAYDIELEPRSSHEIDLLIPFITFTGDDGRAAVEILDYDAKLAEMTDYWQQLIDRGARIQVPEQVITDFSKSTIPHIAITTDKDIKTGYYLLPAGTYDYQVCMNEACHQIRSLDYRGHHTRAREYLRPFYELQGTRGLHGRFKSKEGVFHGLRVDDETDYQTFAYNLDHGYVMFALCEHYKFTRDKDWLTCIASNLVSACDFITRERQSTMKVGAWEYGLLPPGHLEDNPEWLYWYAVNSYCYRGMKAVTEALADIGHAEVERLARDSSAYREDIRRAMRRSMELSPVVRLGDGSFSPFMPTRAQLKGRDVGWIRDSLYGPAHAIECGVLEPNEDMATWILKDMEDNVFVSRARGRQVDLERFWFSQGGNTIQSGLLPMPMIYLKRGQPEHAIRALFNGFAQNIYRDVRCFTEHPVEAFGLGAGPFYKTPDESCWINWLRNSLLMEKSDDCLAIAPGAPKKWFEQGFSVEGMATYFGPMNYSVHSQGKRIVMNLQPPRRNPPSVVEAHFRHPIVGVTVNGEQHAYDGDVVFLRGDLPERVKLIGEYE